MTNQSKISFNCKDALGFLQCLSKDPNVLVNNVNPCAKLIEQIFLKIDKDTETQEKVQAVIALKGFYEAKFVSMYRCNTSNPLFFAFL